jgi:hypothetical protein
MLRKEMGAKSIKEKKWDNIFKNPKLDGILWCSSHLTII